MKKDLILFGGGGQCKSCIDVIEMEGKYRIIGIVDSFKQNGERVGEYRIIGKDVDLPRLIKEYKHCLITFGQVDFSPAKKIWYEKIIELGAISPAIISPLACVSRHAKIGCGVIIMHHAIVNAYAKVGDNCIINTKALIEHDSVVENHVHISTAAVVNGGCTVQESVLIGSGAILKQGIKICKGTIIGAGAVVTRSITQKAVYAGIPARVIKEL